MTALKIGQLAKATDCNNETLRFYEQKGLLEAPRRTPSGYRLYPASAVDRVVFIKRARNMGFSLKEIEELLSLQVDKAHSTCGDVKEIAEAKLTVIDTKINELLQMRSALEQITAACAGGDVPAEQCTILGALESASSDFQSQ